MTTEEPTLEPIPPIELAEEAIITPEILYREVLMPAPVVDFPDQAGFTVPVLVRNGCVLVGNGHQEELKPRAMYLLTLLLHHQDRALSRRACEIYGFAQNLSTPYRADLFTETRAGLNAALAGVKGPAEGLMKGPRVKEWPTYFLSGLKFVCGDGTRVVDSGLLLPALVTEPKEDATKYMSGQEYQETDSAPSWDEIKRQMQARRGGTGNRNTRFI